MKTIKLHPKLALIYTEVSDGNVDKRFASPESVKSARKTIFKALNLQPYQVIEAAQAHGSRLLKLDKENTKMWRGHNVTGVDGFITDQSDAYLMIRVADCVPLCFYDPDHRVVGLVHAGWRGTLGNIHLKALESLIKHYETVPSHLLLWFGPSARACCFTSDTLPEQAQIPAWQPFLKKKPHGWSVDLIGYQMASLKTSGLLKKNMLVDPACTVESPHLFSHLRSKQTGEVEGRFTVIAHLKR